MSDDARLFVNGLDGASGGYLMDPVSPQEVAEAALKAALSPEQIAQLQSKVTRGAEASFGLAEGIDPSNLAKTGWGVVFAFADGEEALKRQAAVRQALAPLLDRRKAQAGARYREYVGPKAIRPGESAGKFLSRLGSGPGPVDPSVVPYYLMLVADPGTVSFEFQYLLDLDYAVGRLHFDAVDDYARYAEGVVKSETTPRVPTPTRRVVLFGVNNPDDTATALSAENLIGPLSRKLTEDMVGESWSVETVVGEGSATKPKLDGFLGGDATPDLLFTASHGLGFPLNDPRQIPAQGALVCQEWPGPVRWGNRPIPEAFYFAGSDLAATARVGGLITFHFACYGAGTPRLDDYPNPRLTARATIAARSFIACLPQRLLSGGALAFVGHVERAWPSSFVWEQAGAQVEVFRSTLKQMLFHFPVGRALEFFNGRYAVLAAFVNQMIQDAKYGDKPDPADLASYWTACNDARGYVLLGDPAVRIPSGPEARPE